MMGFAIRLFGFLLGSFLSGGAAYSYLLKEYKTANDLLTEDIYVRAPSSPFRNEDSFGKTNKLTPPFQTLQASVTRLSNYVQGLEEKIKK